jgi:UDPglucose 6-dehydrogenase
MKISIIGSGVVGKATGIGLHNHGNNVIFYDIEKEKLRMLKKQGYDVAMNQSEAIANSNISFVCVQTPTCNGKLDFSYVRRAILEIGEALRQKNEYHLIVVRSTVLPSTTRTKIIPLLKKHSRLIPGKGFGVCMNPEFMRKESSLSDFLNPWRILIGEFDKRSGDILNELYTPFEAPIIRTDFDTAEMIKYVANTFLATKISFFNEIFMICQNFGIDPNIVVKVAALDPRIGKYGIQGGRPFEGRCLPKDLEAFTNFVENLQINPKLLSAVSHINKEILEYHQKCAHGTT